MNHELAQAIYLRGIHQGIHLAQEEIRGAAGRALPFLAYQEGVAALQAIADDPRASGSLAVLKELVDRGERDTALPVDLMDQVATSTPPDPEELSQYTSPKGKKIHTTEGG